MGLLISNTQWQSKHYHAKREDWMLSEEISGQKKSKTQWGVHQILQLPVGIYSL